MYEPTHPGEILREAIEAEGLTVSEAATRLEVPRDTLTRVVNGRTGITQHLALSLERVGWSDNEHWMRMQAAYDAARTPKLAEQPFVRAVVQGLASAEEGRELPLADVKAHFSRG
jgi:addiction module HigA family antidote